MAQWLQDLILSYKSDVDADTEKLLHNVVRKGLVVYLHSLNTKSKHYAATARAVQLLSPEIARSNFDCLKSAILCIVQDFDRLKKNISRDSKAI